MSIKPSCDYCHKELTDFGALLFSPPDNNGTVKKYHICKMCYTKLTKELEK